MNFQAIETKKPVAIADGILLNHKSVISTTINHEQWLNLNGDIVVRNVTYPSLLKYPALTGSKKKNESIIIAPGGGMMVMAIQHEGISVAKKMAAEGYDAYVLLYRLNATPHSTEAFIDHCNHFYTQLLNEGFGNAKVELFVDEAIDDLKLAIAEVRSQPLEINHKIHFLGFSAGAQIGREFTKKNNGGNSLHSLGMLYGDLSELNIKTDHLPHLFGVMASDDPIFSRKGLGIVHTWHENNKDVEIHFFKNGGHGFGDRINKKTSDAWLNLYFNWLKNISDECDKLEK